MLCLVVVWSANSIKSDWVFEEATEGRTKGCLVPVCIESVRPPPGFREIQAADLVGWDGTATFLGMRTLIEDIEGRIGKPSTSIAGETIHVAPDIHEVHEVHAAHEEHESIDLSQVRSPPPHPASIPANTSVAPSVNLSRRSFGTMAGVALTVLLASGVYIGMQRPEKQNDRHKMAEVQTLNNGPLATSNPIGAPVTAETLNAAVKAMEDQGPSLQKLTKDTANTQAATQDEPFKSQPVGAKHKTTNQAALSSLVCDELLQRVSLGESLSADAAATWKKCAKK
jgi:hypothetical protein